LVFRAISYKIGSEAGIAPGIEKMKVNRLTALEVARAARARGKGKLADGGNLYLVNGASWVLRYGVGGRERFMGLGAVDTTTLAEARQRAHDARRLIARGVDPLEARRTADAAAKTPTFKAFSTEHIAAHKAGWSPEHAKRWAQSLAKDAFPWIGDMGVDQVDTDAMLRMLAPLWQDRPVTGDRLRNRVEQVLDAARAKGLRGGENPARWRGHLDKLLPAARKVSPVEHFEALPHREIAALMAELSRQDGMAPAALRLCILCASRPGEAAGARWDEFDLGRQLWVLPPPRVKQRREHRVALSSAAVAIVEAMADLKMGTDFVFPSSVKRNAPIQPTALLRALHGTGRVGYDAHGLRSSFRTWVSEETEFDSALAEQALGHQVGNAVERSYQRSDVLRRRRALMEAWATYATSGSGVVVPLRA
jgi:integrase